MNKVLRVLVVFSILGGVLQIIATFGFGYQYLLDHDTMAVAVTVGLINLCSLILILLGLVAIFSYSYQKKASLNLLISFIAVFFGTFFEAGAVWVITFVSPMLKVHAAELAQTWPTPTGEGFGFSLFLFALAWVYFGISSAVSKVLPVTASILIPLSLILEFAPFGFISNFGSIFWAIAIIWLSLAVYKRTKPEVLQADTTTTVES